MSRRWAGALAGWLTLLGTASGGGAQSIYTLAGGWLGDGGAATSAGLLWPGGVAVDGAGNLFVAEYGNHRVRRVDGATGVISTVVGNGTSGDAGDGGVATSASLESPVVAVDGAGNLFIADKSTHRVRRVDGVTGVISTVAGDGSWGYAGDGGAATSAHLNNPAGVAVDGAGNLFIADYGNNRVRRVDGMTGVITTVAGNGEADYAGDGGAATSAGLPYPQDVEVDVSGNLFIPSGERVRRVDGVTGVISTVAGDGFWGDAGDGGTATSAHLNSPAGVAVDSSGNLFIADAYNNRIRRVDRATGRISTVAGNGNEGYAGDGGTATSASLNLPNAVTVDGSGNLYIADTGNDAVRRVDRVTGAIATVAGGWLGDGGAPDRAVLHDPSGLAMDRSGNLFIADEGSNRVRQVDLGTGSKIHTVAGNGTAGYSGDGGAATNASLNDPLDVAVDSSGNLFIADASNNRIRRVDALTGVISTVAGDGSWDYGGDGGAATSAQLSTPSGVAVDEAGNLFIADAYNNRIRRVDRATGVISTVAGNGNEGYAGDGGTATSASLSLPNAVTVDGSGNLYIADTGNNAVRRVDGQTGVITTVAGNGTAGYSGDGGAATSASLNLPNAVTVDGSGNLFIADASNNRIRRVDGVTGRISTVAGNGSWGYAGDWVPAISASLAYPRDVALDWYGNLLIADRDNGRVRVARAGSSVADAGPEQIVVVGAVVQLDGSGSSDAYGNALSYRWTAPPGIGLSDPTSVRPTFSAATAGIYPFSLVVNDGRWSDSDPDTVVVTVSGATEVEGASLAVTLPGGATMEFVWIEPGTFTMGQQEGYEGYFQVSGSGTASEVREEITKEEYDGLVLLWAEYNAWVALPTPQGRNVDDDGDGVVDEDRLDFVDNDGDGKIDEDGRPVARPRIIPDRSAVATGPQVTISKGFYLGKYEITQGQWTSVAGTAPWVGRYGGPEVKLSPSHPAVYLSWEDVQGLVHSLNQAAGDSLYRLPTEAEWEYASRAGAATRWFFGNDVGNLANYAWYLDTAGYSAHAVGRKAANPWGLHDMYGNVAEWVQDWYGDYTSTAQIDPAGPATGSYRIARGSTFITDALHGERGSETPDDRNGYLGARLLLMAKPVTATGDSARLAGDFDGSGAVDFSDFFLFADAFGGSDPVYDLDSSGEVDFSDFFLFADAFGTGEVRAKLMELAHQYLGLPTEAGLESTYPNPFNPSTTVRYRLSEPGQVHLTVYGLTGQVVRLLVDGRQEPGSREVTWDGLSDDGRAAATGAYLIRLETAAGVQVRKVTMLR